MKFVHVLTFLFFVSSFQIVAQRPSGMRQAHRGLSISGIVKDSDSGKPIEYSNIVVLRSKDSVQVNGGITNSEGKFKIEKLRPAKYIVKVSFIGFEPRFINDVVLNREHRSINLGVIEITPAAYQLEDAKVIGNKTPIEYKIDKKIINVSEQSTTISGSAVEVLENVPSVRVDIDGNVSLRGSGSFTLLIDGRPTVLDPSDALQQIPASSVEKIEIITNPSAKYDPEGVSGIINIISKENRLNGWSGIVNGNIGTDEKYGGDFTTTYRTKKYSINFGADYNNRNFPGTYDETRRTFNDTLSSFLESTGESERGRNGWSIKLGGDVNLSDADVMGASLRYGNRSFKSNSNVSYFNYTNPPTYDVNYSSKNNRERSGDYFSSNINLKHTFGPQQHELYLEGMYQKRNNDDLTINKYFADDGTSTSGRKTIETGPSERLRIKGDYTYPISETTKLESGVQYESNKSTDNSDSYSYDQNASTFDYQNEYSYKINYDREISSAYGIYSGMYKGVGLQLGLRGEYTYRNISFVDSNFTTLIDRMDFFPTIHATYKINEIQQIMASYTSRIRRPRGYYLTPYEIWSDANNVRRGNPNLQPEYIDSYEFSYMSNWGESLFSIEAYYRIRNNKIERIRSVYAKDVTLITYENVGKDFSLGTELMLNTNPIKIWNINLMGDLYHYRVEGTYGTTDFSKENFNWSVRFNNTFNIFESTKLQINTMYNSPSISAQNEYKGFYMTNIAIKQEFLNKKLSLTLQVRDVFSTAKHEGNSSGPGFESYYLFERNAPVVMLNVSLNLNNYKKQRTKRNSDSDFGDGIDEGGY